MYVRPVKHSLTLKGHHTSVSLEPVFWEAFVKIASRKDKSISQLALEIDETRGLDCGLAGAIRLYVFQDLQNLMARADEL